MTEPDIYALAFLRRLDRLQATADDHTQRLLRLERRLLDRDGETLRHDEALAQVDPRLARIERRLELQDG